MTNKELMTKYHNVLASISEASKDEAKNWQADLGVSLDMLKHEYYAHKGMHGRTHQYEGVPSDFDWDAFGADLGE